MLWHKALGIRKMISVASVHSVSKRMSSNFRWEIYVRDADTLECFSANQWKAKVKKHGFLSSAWTLMMARSMCKGLLWLSDYFQCDRQGSALSMRRLVSSRDELALTFACCVGSVLGTWHPSCLPETSHYGTHHPERFLEACARLLTICPPPQLSSLFLGAHLTFTYTWVQHSLSPPHTKLLGGKSWKWLRTSDSWPRLRSERLCFSFLRG